MNKICWKLECKFHSARVVISFVWPKLVSSIRMPRKALFFLSFQVAISNLQTHIKLTKYDLATHYRVLLGILGKERVCDIFPSPPATASLWLFLKVAALQLLWHMGLKFPLQCSKPASGPGDCGYYFFKC